jgi:hypothetical protein
MQNIALTANSYNLIESMLTCLSHQFGGSPLKVGEDEYTLFRDSEYVAPISVYTSSVLTNPLNRILAKINE